MQFELTTLFLVESDAGSWYRFLVTGTVTGGRLKTPADDDSVSPGKVDWRLDSSSEGWRCPPPDKEREAVPHWHHPVVPALRPHKMLLLGTVILIRKKTNNRMHVLVSEDSSTSSSVK